MSYKENPKTKGSGIECCIPQTGRCPRGCPDCFYQSGRSYLAPLAANLPNLPTVDVDYARVVRVNDGNDSAYDWQLVSLVTQSYPLKFYNTAGSPREIAEIPWDAPFVWTVNPGHLVESFPYLVEPHDQLMFVRVLTTTWNLDRVGEAVDHYATRRRVPVVLTFMSYHREESLPEPHRKNYVLRRRTTNEYWAITTDAWKGVMDRYYDNPWVYSCGRVEGERGKTSCSRCGNCLREYFATMERVRRGEER